MITLIRSVVVMPGKAGEALAFAHQIAKLVTDKVGTAIKINVPVGGNPSRIAWLAHYDNLTQYETMSAQLLADKDYLAAVASSAAIFVPGTMHDELWRKI
jgi:hypothetical protein